MLLATSPSVSLPPVSPGPITPHIVPEKSLSILHLVFLLSHLKPTVSTPRSNLIPEMAASEIPAYFIHLNSCWSPLHAKYVLCNPTGLASLCRIHPVLFKILGLYSSCNHLPGALILSPLYVLIQERSFSCNRNELWLISSVKSCSKEPGLGLP